MTLFRSVEPVIIAVDDAIGRAVGIFVEQVIGAHRELDRLDGTEAEFEVDNPFRRQGKVAGRGAWMQVTAGALTGRHGRRPKYWGEKFVGEGKRSEENTSELQSLMRLSYAVFCLKNKTEQQNKIDTK